MPPVSSVLKFMFIPIFLFLFAACQTAGDRTVFKAQKTASYVSLERELTDEISELDREMKRTKDPAVCDEIRADRTLAARDLDEAKLRARTEKKVYSQSERNAATAERNKFKRNNGGTVQVRVDPFQWFEDDEDEKYLDNDGTRGRDDDLRAHMAERAERRRQRQSR